MDRKTFSFKITNLDFAGRTVEGYANVFGIKDLVGDIVHPGAFSKTLLERGGKIKFLWQHEISEPLGRMLEMHEDQHGLFIKSIVSDTARGRDALALLSDGAVDSFSIGYDVVKGGTDYSKDPTTGETIRNLREIKLWEVSLVTLPANELATVTALKQKPAEGKPYNVFVNGDQHCVYKVDENGKRTGDSLGCHATEDEAMAQIRALHASEGEGKEMTMHGPVQRLGDVLQGSIHQTFTMITDSWYISGMLDRDERILLSSLIGDALDILSNGIPAEIALREINHYGMMSANPNDEIKAGRVLAARNAERIMNAMRLLHEAMADAGLMEPIENDEDKSTTPPGGQAGEQPHDQKAGPAKHGEAMPPPTSETLLRQIEISELEISLYEV